MRKGGIKWFSDTLPHLLTMGLGSVVMFLCSPLLAPIYLLICSLGMLWFWGHICPYCKGYGSLGCPSGNGIISSKLYNRKEGDFKKAFLRNIWAVALQWFIPLLVGIVYLVLDFDIFRLIALLMFIGVAFILLPAVTKAQGCSNCPQRHNCSWKR